MVLNSRELLGIFLGVCATVFGGMNLMDMGWAIIRDLDGTIYEVGLRQSNIITPQYNDIDKEEIVSNADLSKILGQDFEQPGSLALYFLAPACAGSFALVASLFLIGSKVLTRDRGHDYAIRGGLLGGLLYLVSVVVFNLMFPSEFEWHGENDDRIDIGSNEVVVIPQASIDHLGSSFVMTLVASQFTFLSVLSVYFAYPRISFD